MSSHSTLPNPFEELIVRLSRMEEILCELRDLLIDSKACFDKDRTGGIELAMQVTGLARSTIYNLTSKGELPHMKRGKKIYFSYHDLSQWIKEGKQKTSKDIEEEVDSFLTRRSKFNKY